MPQPVQAPKPAAAEPKPQRRSERAAFAAPGSAGQGAQTAAASSYPPLAELPAGVRASLPSLDLQLHFYSPTPERRLVRLNGVNLRQGDRGPNGLTVEEIVPNGIHLSHGGVRFLLPTGRL